MTSFALSSSVTRPLYIGTFLIAFATLSLEITLTRLLSVLTWYHLAFLAIAVALLGATAGSVAIYLYDAWFSAETPARRAAQASTAYAIVTPIALVVMLVLPISPDFSLITLFAMLLGILSGALPFFFAGIAITLMLTRTGLAIGRIYASDLFGAALGCLFVLFGLNWFDAPSLILLNASLGVWAALAFSAADDTTWTNKWRTLLLGVLLTVAAFANNGSSLGLQPYFIKGRVEPAADKPFSRWNSFSRIQATNPFVDPPFYWAASEIAPQEPIQQVYLDIDGLAGTNVAEFSTTEVLRYDVSNVGYYLRPSGGALIIGVGGGRDVQSAVEFGHERVIGLEVNPILVDLLNNQMRDFVGIVDHPSVQIVTDEARGYLSRSNDTFALIQMSLIDTWAATGAGAFTLTENALYTVEGWQVFIDRLTDDGIFTVSRWHAEDELGETGRLLSLAVASLHAQGIENPQDHLVLVTREKIATLLLKRSPFTEAELAQLDEISAEHGYALPIFPNRETDHPVLNKIVQTSSPAALRLAVADEPLNYLPSTDEQPYFFNMLRLTPASLQATMNSTGVNFGNLVATITLVVLIAVLAICAVGTSLVPLWLHQSAAILTPDLRRGALYFSLIGSAFMFVEIALIQRLSIFLSHPVYALGITLFTIIASTGVGSYLSERLPLHTRRFHWGVPLATAVAIIVIRFVLTPLLGMLESAELLTRASATVVILFPIGILLGLFFPMGMRLFGQDPRQQHATPWYWALNGVFSVLCSALAVFISIFIAVSANFILAAVLYLCTIRLLLYTHKLEE